MIRDAVKSGTPIDGADGLLSELTKGGVEEFVADRMAHHLGYKAGDPAGPGAGIRVMIRPRRR